MRSMVSTFCKEGCVWLEGADDEKADKFEKSYFRDANCAETWGTDSVVYGIHTNLKSWSKVVFINRLWNAMDLVTLLPNIGALQKLF